MHIIKLIGFTVYLLITTHMISLSANAEMSEALKTKICHINLTTPEFFHEPEVEICDYMDNPALFHQLLQEKCNDTGKIETREIETGYLASSLKEIGSIMLLSGIVAATHSDPPSAVCLLLSMIVIAKAGYYLDLILLHSNEID